MHMAGYQHTLAIVVCDSSRLLVHSRVPLLEMDKGKKERKKLEAVVTMGSGPTSVYWQCATEDSIGDIMRQRIEGWLIAVCCCSRGSSLRTRNQTRVQNGGCPLLEVRQRCLHSWRCGTCRGVSTMEASWWVLKAPPQKQGLLGIPGLSAGV